MTVKKASKDFKSASNTYNRNKTLENRQRFTKLRTKYNKIKRKAINKYKTNEGKRVCNLAKDSPKTFLERNLKKNCIRKRKTRQTIYQQRRFLIILKTYLVILTHMMI